jgi:hypothetical protein
MPILHRGFADLPGHAVDGAHVSEHIHLIGQVADLEVNGQGPLAGG